MILDKKHLDVHIKECNMSEKTQLKPKNAYQIHKGRVVESKSSDGSKYIQDLGHIEERELTDYEDLVVEDITKDDDVSFESFDSGNRLVRTENGEFLIVHHSIVDTGSWSNILPSNI